MKPRGFRSRTEIAKALGISRKTLYNKIKSKELSLPSGKLDVENQKKIMKILKT